jgi:hypothetical protein
MDESIRQNILNTITKGAQLEDNKDEKDGKKKKTKHKLQDNDELLEYVMVDGVRKKKVLRRIKRVEALSEEEVEEIYSAFSLFDKDGSGTIDSNELKDAMKALGIYVNKDGLKKLMEKADKDGSGTIEKGEFLSLMAEMIQKRNPRAEVMKSFRFYDDDDGGNDGDGSKGGGSSGGGVSGGRDAGDELEAKDAPAEQRRGDGALDLDGACDRACALRGFAAREGRDAYVLHGVLAKGIGRRWLRLCLRLCLRLDLRLGHFVRCRLGRRPSRHR